MKPMPALSLPTLALAGALAFGLGGCTSWPVVPAVPGTTAGSFAYAAHNPLIASSHQAIDRLTHDLDTQTLADGPVLVATLVNVNQLAQSAPLGRALSEMYASQLAQQGLNVKEMKLRGEVFVREGTGELLLSRELRDIAQLHSAALVLVGTYAQAQHNTYVSLKLVRTSDSRIVHSHDYALPHTPDVLRLLTSEP